MRSVQLSLADARRLAIEGQRLGGKAPFGSGKKAVLNSVEHLGYVQIDTISVIERAHHHILWSRVPDYQSSYLQELQVRDRQIFEYWSHAAAFLPMRDFRFSLPRMQRIASGKKHWFKRDLKVMATVMDRIKAEGPLQARDFEAPKGRKGAGWFEWKPAKRALEQLFMEGSLMIRERRGFQKVFDLSTRVIPAEVDQRTPSEKDLARHLILQTLRAHGIASPAEIRYQRKFPQSPISKALGELEESGDVVRAVLEGVPAGYFVLESELKKLHSPEQAKGHACGELRILSPFDGFVIQRKRLWHLFNFDYQIECYVPAKKRKFGYFSLPLLWRNNLIGRIDVKADRNERLLRIQSIHWEREIQRERGAQSRAMDALKAALPEFARFNGCEIHELTS